MLRNTMLDLLIRIDRDGGFSHLVIDNEIKRRNIKSQDRSLLTEVVYGTIERKLTLDFWLKPFIQTNKKLDNWVKMLLQMSLYQMFFLDRIPTHAVIHEAVEIAKERGHQGIASFVNGVLRNIQRKGVRDPKEINDQVQRLVIETSHPQWLVERWIKHYDFTTTKNMCFANIEKKSISVRIQPLKISRSEAMTRLSDQGFEVRPSLFSKQGIIIEKGNILESPLLKEGMLTIQDQSSMLVAEMLQPQPGMKVLDACSAPGGKATHIAEKMQNEGKVYAYDIHQKKIRLVTQRADQLDLTIIDAKQGDARKLQDFHEPESFDRILVDAPCSGLGVIRSKPEIKYQKSLTDIKRLATIQLDILRHIAPLLKEGGKLVYSTCTVDVAENENVVKNFLLEHSEFNIDQEFFTALPEALRQYKGISEYGLQIFPQSFQSDGFFLTRMIKTSKTRS